MTIIGAIRQRIPKSGRAFAKRFTRKAKLQRCLSPFLPEVICVDVGASYYPHVKWHLFLESPRTHWIAVEPNAANLTYLKDWPWPSRVSSFTTGLSKEGGSQTLFVTNIDSGSSLLEPVIPPSLARRIRNLDYFFPVTRHEIDTRTLPEVVQQLDGELPVFVKLDTQGTELSILSGAEGLIRDRRILGIELEATLLAQPVMRGAGKFWEACRYLEELGLELLLIHPIYGPSRLGVKRSKGLTFINECDAVFAIRQDIASSMSVECRVSLLAFYLCNRLFEEAVVLLQEDAQVRGFLEGRGCPTDELTAIMKEMA